MQREKKILREIEGDPSDKLNMETADLMTSGGDEQPTLIEILDTEEFLSNDMCKERAINWGKGKPLVQPVVLAIQNKPQYHKNNQM